MTTKTTTNVTCPFCGCCCDDIEVTTDGHSIVSVRNGCALSISKFLNWNKERNAYPMLRRGPGLKRATYKSAIKRAASILADAEYPLLYGWSSTSCEAIKTGVELAETVQGVIDNTTTTCHGPSIVGVHDIGEVACTLGEIRHRADLVVYWGSNPVHAHPRHISRYTVGSKGRFRKSRKERQMIVVDVRKTDTARIADRFVRIEPNQDYELLCALRAAVRDDEIEQDVVAGVPVEEIEDIADLLINCEYGVIFFGLGLTMSPGKSRNIDAALSLAKDLNTRTKFSILPMRGHFNVTGANAVTTWQTGYPFAVDFSQGYPRYNPGETSAVDILSRRDCDAALVVASDPISNLPASAARWLAEIPLVTIDPRMSATTKHSEVVLPSTLVGIETDGTVYRMDGVPLMLRKVVEPPRGIRSDREILESILAEVRGRRSNA